MLCRCRIGPIEIATMNENRRERERERAMAFTVFSLLQHHFLLFIWDLVWMVLSLCRIVIATAVVAAAAVTYKVNKCVVIRLAGQWTIYQIHIVFYGARGVHTSCVCHTYIAHPITLISLKRNSHLTVSSVWLICIHFTWVAAIFVHSQFGTIFFRALNASIR